MNCIDVHDVETEVNVGRARAVMAALVSVDEYAGAHGVVDVIILYEGIDHMAFHENAGTRAIIGVLTGVIHLVSSDSDVLNDVIGAGVAGIKTNAVPRNVMHDGI